MAFNSSRIKLLLESPAAAANDFEKCGRSSKSSLFILLQVFLATSGAQTNRTQHTHTHTHRKVAREKSAFRCSDSCLASYTRRNKRKASAFNMLSVSNFKATESSYHMRNMSPLLMRNRRGNEVEAHNNMATYRDFSWRTLSNVTTDH